MFRKPSLAAIFFVLTATSGVCADSQCLPNSLFPTGDDAQPQPLELGLVGGVPTLCAANDEQTGGLAGCWTVDPDTGALSASNAEALPGRSQRGKPDANGCIAGYCLEPKPSSDEPLLWATSTDGAHAVILRDFVLHVFDAQTKAEAKAIPLSDETSPSDTNVGNEPIELLYTGSTIYVVGTDAGPYIAVWRYKDDGTRVGLITTSGGHEESDSGFSVYNGGVNVLDDGHVAIADAGLQKMLIFDANGTRDERSRSIDMSACTSEEMANVNIGDYQAASADNSGEVSQACHDAVVKNLEPYFDLDPVRLPSGGILATLSGKGRGSVAILDETTLAEKKRIELKRCEN